MYALRVHKGCTALQPLYIPISWAGMLECLDLRSGAKDYEKEEHRG